MTLEKEILDLTNWLYDNNWELIGGGMCLNHQTKKTSSVNELIINSKLINDYYPQDFKVGDIVKSIDGGNIVELTNVEYDKYKREYKYWFKDEDGEEWYGFGDEFSKLSINENVFDV